MKIELYPQPIHDASNIIDGLNKMFINFANIVNVPLNALEKIIITDKTNWASKVEELQKEYYGEKTGYTKNDLYVAVAKKLFRIEDGNVFNTIVFNSYVIFRPNDIEKLKEEEKAFFELCDYTIFHELRHCLDNSLRQQCEVKAFEFKEGKIIEPAFFYNIDILFSELAACIHSAKWMSEKALDFEIKSTKENLAQMFNYVETIKNDFLDGKQTLYDLAFNAACLFWTILIQHAKIIGIVIGLKLEEFFINSLCPENRGQEIITEFQNVLMILSSNYPDWTNEHKRQVLAIWNKLSREYGYSFTHTPNGDYLYV